MRGFGDSLKISNGVSRTFDQQLGGFQIGTDRRLRSIWKGDLFVGGFAGYFHASRDFNDGGDGSTDAFSVGAYATWIHPAGWYADLVGKYTQLWNDFRTPTLTGSTASANYSIPVFGGSLEIGRRIDFWRGRLFLEPEAQLTGAWAEGSSYNVSNWLRVLSDDQTSLQGRFGGRFGFHFDLNDNRKIELYGRVEVIQEFLTDGTIRTDTTPFTPSLSGTTVRVGAGVATRLSDSINLYGEYDYANSDKVRQPWGVNVGFRWQW